MDAIELIPQLISSLYEGNRRAAEVTAITIIRSIKKDYPKVADEISAIISKNGVSSNTRSAFSNPLPVDRETRFALVDIKEPSQILPPILSEYTSAQLCDFIKERKMLKRFIKAGITPPNGMLLYGPPGVGKTYIARWISAQLNLPLITLDLATSISSYLGRSGQNLRNIFDYAKSRPSVLLLDEIDAIAKKRDDAADLGELKRLVNVLLKEIENYPYTGIIIGATNHPELLDKAIWRRFDRELEIEMPEFPQRKELLIRHLEDFISFKSDLIDFLAENTDGVNSADVCKLCEHIKRQIIIDPKTPVKVIALAELFKAITISDKGKKQSICVSLKKEFKSLSQRDIAKITHIPLSTVSRYLSTMKSEE